MVNDANFLEYLRGRGQAFNSYSAGSKVYGGGRSAPNIGPVGDRTGYIERDAMARVKRNAMLRRLQAATSGKYMSADYLKPQQGNW